MLPHRLFGMRIPLTSCGTGTVAVAVGLLLGATSGCNESLERPQTFPVGGKVTYKGQPVPKGTITFQPGEGQAAVGEIQADGSYRLTTFVPGDGALPGHHRVVIVANTADPNKMPGSTPGWTPPKDIVPKKYNTVATSGLEATVSKDQPNIDFNLE